MAAREGEDTAAQREQGSSGAQGPRNMMTHEGEGGATALGVAGKRGGAGSEDTIACGEQLAGVLRPGGDTASRGCRRCGGTRKSTDLQWRAGAGDVTTCKGCRGAKQGAWSRERWRTRSGCVLLEGRKTKRAHVVNPLNP